MRAWLSIILLPLGLSACEDRVETRAENEAAIEQAVAPAIATPESLARTSKVAVRIRVIDNASGRPVADANISDLGYLSRSTGDDGVYTGIALVEPQGSFSIYCRAAKPFVAGDILATPHYSVIDGRIDMTIDVDATRCGTPPSKRRARFAGMYAPEFESSLFFPCDGLPKATENPPDTSHGVWADVPKAVADELTWARTRESIIGEGDGFYVEWTGTLTGPGSYGHMGMSLYEFRAETVHDTSDKRPVSCKAPGYTETVRERERWRRRQASAPATQG